MQTLANNSLDAHLDSDMAIENGGSYKLGAVPLNSERDQHETAE